ncbi:Luciferase-like domain-containing protein [Frankia sp. AiPs1]|uniref:LLM class flavin-dependent oxidoreductase n=1 Tax=Frankia sp. AiPa1 TaxID=573492 RepID=UPI00202AF5A4|nr:LLM class flavin-dependent oxidoreductase [Frankia sp. AiPa1]MCL9760177.1 LLM class flavin-dependent oxidoreductase [Frankia sp. AiPa1]
MPVELVGVLPSAGREVDGSPRAWSDALRRLADAHEAAGFDRVLVPAGPAAPDSHQVAAHVAVHTRRLGLLVEHRPGLAQPTVAARALASLDQFSDGRVAVYLPVCAPEHERRRDGDVVPHHDVRARDLEYLRLLRRTWAARDPVDVVGRFFRVEHYVNHVPPVHGHIPVYIGGSGDEAVRFAREEADVWLLPADLAPAAVPVTATGPDDNRGSAEEVPDPGSADAALVSARRPDLGMTLTLTSDTEVHTLIDHVEAGATTLVLDGYELDGRLRALLAEVREHAAASQAGEATRATSPRATSRSHHAHRDHR